MPGDRVQSSQPRVVSPCQPNVLSARILFLFLFSSLFGSRLHLTFAGSHSLTSRTFRQGQVCTSSLPNPHPVRMISSITLSSVSSFILIPHRCCPSKDSGQGKQDALGRRRIHLNPLLLHLPTFHPTHSLLPIAPTRPRLVLPNHLARILYAHYRPEQRRLLVDTGYSVSQIISSTSSPLSRRLDPHIW
jgi:hypothetical protein